MAELYFYVPRAKIKDIVECGLKLSEWYDREISFPQAEGNRKVLKAFLNPRDDVMRLKDSSYQCLRLDVELEYCRVADASLYQMGLVVPEMMERYGKSIMPLAEYRFGKYRNPEVLVFTSVLPERIEVTGKALDIPILYESSELLYLNNLMELHEETYKDSGNHLLYAFFVYLESMGKVVKYEERESRTAVFVDNNTGQYAVLRIP